jgi:hypothetical protein
LIDGEVSTDLTQQGGRQLMQQLERGKVAVSTAKKTKRRRRRRRMSHEQTGCALASTSQMAVRSVR